jgi:hypothetical protein
MKCKNPRCSHILTRRDVLLETRWRCPESRHTRVYPKPGTCKVPDCNRTLKEKSLPMGHLCPLCKTVNP